MGERGQGTGPFPVTTRQGKLSYRVAVTMADGTRVWRQRATKRAAEDARRQLVEARALELDPSRQTLAAFLRSWIDGYAGARNARIRPRTLDHYRLVVERHIIPELGHLKLSAVTARRVQAWVDADTGAPRTVRHHHAVLRRALNVAVRQRMLAYNPALAVELPAPRGDVARPLTLADAKRLLAATADDRLGPLWRLALVTGLRQGELLGLGWDDIEGDRITVRAQLQRRVTDEERDAAKAEGRKPVGSWTRTAPKAARRLTTVSIDAATAAALEAHRLAMAKERTADWPYHGLVFTTSTGQPYHQAEIGKAFRAACKRAGIEGRRFHDLRHSAAHLLTDAGVAKDTRKARLGHSSDRMAEHYGGASEAQDRLAADTLGRALHG